MTRHESRLRVFELLYEIDFHKDEEYQEIYDRSVSSRDVKDSEFVRRLYSDVTNNLSEIDETINGFSEKWKVGRMGAVTRAVLRTCTGELLYGDTPAKAAINEAVEIAKEYDEEKAPAFINGILNKIARENGKITDGDLKSE